MNTTITMIALFISILSFSEVRSASICGYDSRLPSAVRPIGRLYGNLSKNTNCTATLISSNCVLTAGHCMHKGTFDYVEFNVPLSNAEGSHTRSESTDMYEVEKVVGFKNLVGNDWAVLKLRNHTNNGAAPGIVQGYMQLTLSPKEQFVGKEITITGFGYSEDNRLNYTQQSAGGRVLGTTKIKSMLYDVDTESGNSGSVIVLQETQEIIGVHTNGGCSYKGEHNEGTILATNKRLLKAIKECRDQ